MSSLLKWAGGKEQELKYIQPLLPSFQNYYEPFVGGGAVFFSVQAEKKFINDKSPELMHLYMMVAENNQHFFHILDILHEQWLFISDFVDKNSTYLIELYTAFSTDAYDLDKMQENMLAFISCHSHDFTCLIAKLLDKHATNFLQEIQKNAPNKLMRMKAIEGKKGKLSQKDIVANLESAFKSAFYMHLRHLYNHKRAYDIPSTTATAIFFFIRENAYASMFRYNSHGAFNVPYGGISYNRKDLARKIAYLKSPNLQQYLAQTVIENMDFEAFLQKHVPKEDDFIFLDPPYDSEFSTYAQNEFRWQDQERLAEYLLNYCKAKFMLVIKNTKAIYELYSGADLRIRDFDKKYLVSFQDRNERNVNHLIITNF